ncbi:putative transcription factor WD40-like family [Helianthus annuus]|nr:putative transcription factor WD40-like family [Helianthus annuus]KAJ0641409.1 putative transcription factor WD40-like family [Helianthus annuus]KAJ0645306.1 putative transcription factor WD40-like family [Helianthus annuus]
MNFFAICMMIGVGVVSGIALPVGSDKLYTGSRDDTVRVWDCQSGQGLLKWVVKWAGRPMDVCGSTKPCQSVECANCCRAEF